MRAKSKAYLKHFLISPSLFSNTALLHHPYCFTTIVHLPEKPISLIFNSIKNTLTTISISCFLFCGISDKFILMNNTKIGTSVKSVGGVSVYTDKPNTRFEGTASLSKYGNYNFNLYEKFIFIGSISACLYPFSRPRKFRERGFFSFLKHQAKYLPISGKFPDG